MIPLLTAAVLAASVDARPLASTNVEVLDATGGGARACALAQVLDAQGAGVILGMALGKRDKTELFHSASAKKAALALAAKLGLHPGQVKPLTWRARGELVLALGAESLPGEPAAGSFAPGVCPGMAFVPGGSYTFKASREESVTLPSFLMDMTEVTAGAFANCVKAGACRKPTKGGNGTYGVAGKENHPINFVDLEQAKAYCTWAGKRLPDEHEWEWAARGADQGTKYPWGNMEPVSAGGERAKDLLCWMAEDSAVGVTCPVGTYPKGDSPQGLKDLSGNVSEWTTSDFFQRLPTSTPERAVRGGAFVMAMPTAQTAVARSGRDENFAMDALGFRCVRKVP